MKSQRPAGVRTGRRIARTSMIAAFLVVIGCTGLSMPRSAGASHAFRWFWVQRSGQWRHVRCAELASGSEVRIFAVPGQGVSRHTAARVVSVFEQQILPADTRVFGQPRSLFPVDILFLGMDSLTIGYFDPNDAAPRALQTDPAHSNNANVLYVRPPDAMPDASKFADTAEVIAHELQHLIDYRIRVIDHQLPAQEVWLNEGLSFYAQLVNGYWTPRDVQKVDAAAAEPSWPVTSLTQSIGFLNRNGRVAYGRSGLFVTYLGGRFGSSFIHSLMTSPLTGMSAIDGVLRSQHRHLNIASVYADWSAAQVLHRGSHFGYGPLSARLVQPPALISTDALSYPFDSQEMLSRAQTLQPWGQAFYRFDVRGPSSLRISVKAPIGQFRVAIVQQKPGTQASPHVISAGLHHGSGSFTLRGKGQGTRRVTLAISYIGSVLVGDPVTATVRVGARLVRATPNHAPRHRSANIMLRAAS